MSVEAINLSEPLAFKTAPSFSGGGNQAPLKWSKSNGNSSATEISYAFAEGSNYPGLGLDRAKSLFSQALNVWSQYAPLNFKEVPDPGQDNAVDIRVKSANIDGRKGTLGYAYFPNAGDITFDQGEQWSESLFLETAVHEIGHSLGLDHDDRTDALMNSSLIGRYADGRDPFLLKDDIDGIRSLYGNGKGAVNSLNGLVSSRAENEFDSLTQGGVAQNLWPSFIDSVQGNNPIPISVTDLIPMAQSTAFTMGVSQVQSLGLNAPNHVLASDSLLASACVISPVELTGFI